APVLGGDVRFAVGGGSAIPLADQAAVTAPRFRFDLAIRYAPTGRDTDGDGGPDRDNDGDGVPDDKDRCRDAAETVDGFQDEDGCPDADDDGDGVPDEQDKCRNAPEDKDGFQDAE